MGFSLSFNIGIKEDIFIKSCKHNLTLFIDFFLIAYYWDSFWSVHGLLLCGMNETARGIIKNFSDMINIYGFIPNGNRSYYLNRSQPPMLSEMVQVYFEETNDLDLVKSVFPSLEKEYEYYTDPDRRQIEIKKNGQTYKLSRYCAAQGITSPRPESYIEDFELAMILKNNQQENYDSIYSEIAAACESGWDFTCVILKRLLIVHLIFLSLTLHDFKRDGLEITMGWKIFISKN